MKKSSKIDEKKYHLESQLIHGKDESDSWDYSHHLVPPISAGATYKLDTAERGAQGFSEFAHTDVHDPSKSPIYIYERLGEPNKNMLEENLALAEGGEMALTFSTGMAAISGILCTLNQSGDEIIHHHTVYGCTYSLLINWLPRFNIQTTKVNLQSPENLKDAITDKTRTIYFETPVNPTMEIVDIAEVTKIVSMINENRPLHRKIYVVVDNTFATPVCQRPLQLGADFVVHSLTKNIGGFGTDMGGAVIGKSFIKDMLLLYRKDFGGVLAFHSAWSHLVYGLPTLNLRVRQQEKSALKIAKYLDDHDWVQLVRYPGLDNFREKDVAKKQMISPTGDFAPGTMIYFVVKGDTPEIRKELGRLLMNYISEHSYTMTLAVSLGNIKTLIEHPGSMTHSVIPAEEQIKHGIEPGGIRLSIGIENADDLINDLKQAFIHIRETYPEWIEKAAL